MKDDVAALEERVARIEQHLALKTPEEERADQEAADKALLSRNATTYEEAVAQEEARARLEGREPNTGDGAEEVSSTETPPES